jgi:hypothetical protein
MNKTTYLVTYIICNSKFKQLAKLVHFSMTQNVREITTNDAYNLTPTVSGSQKCHIHEGAIHSGSGAMSIC